MLPTILIAIAGALVLFLALVATRPSAYRVVRAGEVTAPPEVVFGALNDLQQFANVLVFFGSPLKKADPSLQLRFEGSAVGVGQALAWSSKDGGAGTLTITESVPARKVGLHLEFVKPMASRAIYALALERTPAGSSVTWSMEGNHNFLGKAFGLFMDMDKALGADLEKGLARLQTEARTFKGQ